MGEVWGEQQSHRGQGQGEEYEGLREGLQEPREPQVWGVGLSWKSDMMRATSGARPTGPPQGLSLLFLEASSHSSQLCAPTLNTLSPVGLGAPVISPRLLTSHCKAALLEDRGQTLFSLTPISGRN